MKQILLFLLVPLSLCITACSGAGDWTYVLPNGYEVWRVNSDEILIKYVDSEIDVDGIPSFVKEFAYDERYVFSRNVDIISNNNILEESYYILDTEERKTYGPFQNIEELIGKTKDLGGEIPKNWYRTSRDPNM